MNCNLCPFNASSKHYDSKLLQKIPSELNELFECDQNDWEYRAKNQLCPMNLWVLAFIDTRDKLAKKFAVDTMEQIIAQRNSQLLCLLFENSDYETRNKMWQTMTIYYHNHMYLFNALFEKEDLEPIAPELTPQNLHIYRHYLLYNNCNASIAKDFT